MNRKSWGCLSGSQMMRSPRQSVRQEVWNYVPSEDAFTPQSPPPHCTGSQSWRSERRERGGSCRDWFYLFEHSLVCLFTSVVDVCVYAALSMGLEVRAQCSQDSLPRHRNHSLICSTHPLRTLCSAMWGMRKYEAEEVGGARSLYSLRIRYQWINTQELRNSSFSKSCGGDSGVYRRSRAQSAVTLGTDL